MIIAGPTSSEDETTALADQGFYLSRVSETYAEFDRDQFAAALDDWGWYGPDERRPAWYTGTAWSS
jgi:hypothetical protein